MLNSESLPSFFYKLFILNILANISNIQIFIQMFFLF